MIGHYLPDDDADANLARDFYELASDEQLDFFPATYWRGLIDQVDHQVSVLSEHRPARARGCRSRADHAQRRGR